MKMKEYVEKGKAEKMAFFNKEKENKKLIEKTKEISK
jgi:hypothetical protein